MTRITVICFDDVLSASISTFVDAFNIANQLWSKMQPGARPLFAWTLVTERPGKITTSSGLKLHVDARLPGNTDLIFIPALHFESIEKLMEDTFRITDWCGKWIGKQYRNKTVIAAGCSGTFILAQAGLINGKTITTSWWLKDYFRTLYPEVKLDLTELIVEDSRILTAGPVNSHFNLAMKIIGEIGGYQLSMACARAMLIDVNRPTQVAYEIYPVHKDHTDEAILLAQNWIQKNIRKSFDMSEPARVAHLGQRTFIRRFKKATGITPIKFIQSIKIDLAKRLMESSDLSLSAILDRVGYADISSFRRMFKARTNLTPMEYKKRFGRGH